MRARKRPALCFASTKTTCPALDHFEDYPSLYDRKEVEIITADGPLRAMLYIMRHPLRAARPAAHYVETLRRGYRDFGLPTEALEGVLGEGFS